MSVCIHVQGSKDKRGISRVGQLRHALHTKSGTNTDLFFPSTACGALAQKEPAPPPCTHPT